MKGKKQLQNKSKKPTKQANKSQKMTPPKIIFTYTNMKKQTRGLHSFEQNQSHIKSINNNNQENPDPPSESK